MSVIDARSPVNTVAPSRSTITRVAALQIAREERVDFLSALRFTWRRILAFA